MLKKTKDKKRWYAFRLKRAGKLFPGGYRAKRVVDGGKESFSTRGSERRKSGRKGAWLPLPRADETFHLDVKPNGTGDGSDLKMARRLEVNGRGCWFRSVRKWERRWYGG